MTLVYGLIWGATVLFGASAVWALSWAVRSGQMRDFAAAARSIFDEGELVGTEGSDAPRHPEAASIKPGEQP